MGQLERYGLYVLCVVIFLILGVALWGGDPALAGTIANPPAAARDLNAQPAATEPPVQNANPAPVQPSPEVRRDDAVANLRERFVGSSATDPQRPTIDDGSPQLESLAGLSTAAPAPGPKAGNPPASGGSDYVVKKGDTLEEIAEAYFGKGNKNAWREIVKVNPDLRPTAMRPGQTIKMPPRSVLAKAASTSTPVAADEYVIKSGDSLESIAKARLGKGSLWREIEAINPGLNPAALRPGSRIKIPAKR